MNKLKTEKRHPDTYELDNLSIREILQLMNYEDKIVPNIVEEALPFIEPLVEKAETSIRQGGRLIYVGAGTSGRLAILDAAECPPTFGTTPETVQGIIAGGKEALLTAVEGAEDSENLGASDLKKIHLASRDIVIGVAASGRTPYVIGALSYAKEIGAVTGSISCNKDAPISALADYSVEAETGPEILTGSTRLKAGTAQKNILNMISTITMIRLGKVYENFMVDVQATNQKLARRSMSIIQEVTGVDEQTAASIFEASGRHVKTAVVMILADATPAEATVLLEQNHGRVREAIINK
ncbi:N-acetylmuramic acid 6-phosphate etherase [Marinococcus halophilus]|uniref:N-acetylmuramic acid 6-phosphate etherase n=1 Tax=Marinococcus halophilus TaxID=1371 RepID=A0A510Y480_MARHA|nr:N-acetylmuramic acid 6-phosphate etherase 2 [Marinococcus halophilus]